MRLRVRLRERRGCAWEGGDARPLLSWRVDMLVLRLRFKIRSRSLIGEGFLLLCFVLFTCGEQFLLQEDKYPEYQNPCIPRRSIRPGLSSVDE